MINKRNGEDQRTTIRLSTEDHAKLKYLCSMKKLTIGELIAPYISREYLAFKSRKQAST